MPFFIYNLTETATIMGWPVFTVHQLNHDKRFDLTIINVLRAREVVTRLRDNGVRRHRMWCPMSIALKNINCDIISND